jgi:hypothetical protein
MCFINTYLAIAVATKILSLYYINSAGTPQLGQLISAKLLFIAIY